MKKKTAALMKTMWLIMLVSATQSLDAMTKMETP